MAARATQQARRQRNRIFEDQQENNYLLRMVYCDVATGGAGRKTQASTRLHFNDC